MAVSDGCVELLKDLLADFAPVTARRMFSGVGLYAEGVMFGLVVDDTLYLKVDDTTRPDFEAEAMVPFSYEAKTRRVITSCWRASERLLDDPEEMRGWARAALGVAKRAAARKARKSASRPRRATQR